MIDYDLVIPEQVREIKPSGIRKFFDMVSTMKGVISLTVGQPDFVTPWHIREAAIASLVDGKTYYTSNAGMQEIRNEIARYLARRFSLSYTPQETFVTVGGSEAIDLALRACVERGDEVLIPDPAYVSYSPLVLMSDGVPVHVECLERDNFVLKPEYLEKAITPKTKALILTYPNNPTGGIMTKSDLEAIAKIVIKHELLVISDEIYAELTYGQKHASIAQIPGMKERTVYVSGFSKAFAMTGWRMGYVCAPPQIDEAMFKIHQYGIMCAPTMSQFAAIEALKDGLSDNFATVEEMRESYDKRRKFVLYSLKEIGLDCFEPRGAFYAFPSVRSTGLNGEAFANGLLASQKVAVVPGNAFGQFGEHNVRLSYATSMNSLSEAFDRMSKFLAQNR